MSNDNILAKKYFDSKLFWVNEIYIWALEIAISDIGEYVVAYGQFDGV